MLIKKRVIASSIKDALANESKAEILEVFVEVTPQQEDISPGKMGFNT